MASTEIAPWLKFTVGKKSSNPRFTEPDCCPLTEISHVTHINNALQVISSGQITAGLIYDKSTLNTTRTTVIWLSPNNWSGAGGYRYGNVEFVFDWRDILTSMNAYRIEVQEYKPLAFRILLTTQDLDATHARYDIEKGPGPWRYDRLIDEHQWNGEICLEVMLSANLGLDRCKRIEFVKHHENRCNIDSDTCKDRGLTADKGGALFVSAVVARQLSLRPGLLTGIDPVTGKTKGTRHLEHAWEGIFRKLRDKSIAYSSKLTIGSPLSQAMARAVLGAVAADNDTDRRELCTTFKNLDDLVGECASVIESHFGIDAAHPLER